MRQAGGVHQVGIAAEARAELAADLRALERVGQPGAREVAGAGPTTCVFAASLRSAELCSTRARSRWNSVRPGRLGGSAAQRSASPGLYVTPLVSPTTPTFESGREQAKPADRVKARAGGRGRAGGPPPVAVGAGQRVSLPTLATAARPASRRATGTRNGEQDT